MMATDLRPLHREPAAVRPPFDRARAPLRTAGAARGDRLAALHEVLDGVELGAYDERIIEWLAGWDTATVGTVVSLLGRARGLDGAR